MTKIESGFFFITDITGYTLFLSRSELLHAKEILDTLFDVILVNIEPPLKVLTTQGDAVICYAPADSFQSPQTLMETMEHIYFSFRRQLNLMRYNTTCRCQACKNMSMLDLKVFLHYGEYMEQVIDDRIELQGADVILIHRVMKNSVKESFGITGYGLLTQAAVDRMDADALTKDLPEYAESYEHFGEVAMRIMNLEAAWEDVHEAERDYVDPDKAWVKADGEVPIAIWPAWEFATRPERKVEYFGMESITRTDGQEGRVGKAVSFHCHHEMGDLDYILTDWRPPYYFTGDTRAFGVRLWFTCMLEQTENGVRFILMYDAPVEGDAEQALPIFTMAAEGARDRYIEMVEKALVAGEAARFEPNDVENLRRTGDERTISLE